MAYNVFNLYGYGGNVLGDKKENDFLKLLRENQKIGYGINDTYTPPAKTQAATPNTQDPMEELRRRLNIPEPEPFVNPITNPHQSQILQKWGEMTTPLAATIADVGGNVGLGMAKGIEGIMDAGSTVGAWGARAIGADQAEQKIRDFIVKDHFGDDGSFSDAMVDAGSLLGNGKAGDIIRGVSQGVGQMLPSVAVSLIPGVGQAGALATLGLSADGGGVEEALSEGAGLGRATLYGAATAGTEIFFEKLVGGPMAKVFGGGWLDDVTGSVLKVGAGRVAKNAVGEGVEEGLAELASPLLKSIYKGVDAFSEYGDKDYWKGVGESALIGAGTSVAFGGTVGRAMGTSGKAADVASLADDISSNANRRMELYREGKITEGDENDRRTSRTMLADYQKLQEILQKTDATERSRLIKANNLGGVVDENGTVRPSVLASLTIEGADSQTPTGEQNAAQSKKTPLSGAYLSPGLWRQSEKVQSDLAGISDDLKANGKEGKPVELFRGDLSEAAQENYNAFKRAASKLSLQSDNKLQFALIDAPSGVSGVHRGGTVYLNTETLEDGKWARVLFEEATHFTDGTAEAADFKAFLEKEDGLFEDVAEGLLAQGNAYGFTDENVMGEKSETFNREMYAHMASRVLTSPEYVDKLVRADRTLAEKIKNRISDVAETLRSVTSKDIEIRKQLRQATKAQGLFERALEGADGKGTEVDFLFAGKNAKTADKMRLATAEKMLEGGVDSETIRKETGWHQGYDGKWRFEIDDFDSRTIENPKIERHDDDGEIYYTGELGDIFDHKLLFEAYPELKDINIVIQPTDYGVDAIYQPNSNYITLSREHFKRYTKAYEDYLNGGRKDEIAKIEQTPEFLEYEKWYDDEVADNMDPMEWLAGEKAAREKFFSSELGKRYHQLKYSKDGFTGDKFEAGWGKEAKTVLIHELQHAIQNIEGFATGTNTKDPNYDKNAGEIEGYDAGRRANMTAEERKNTRPEIDRPDAVVRRNGIYYDANSKRAQEDAVRTQIRDHLDEINQMEPVTKITFDSSKITDNIIAKKMAVEEFKNFGSQIDRQGFGIILIGKDEIGTGIGYVHTPAERAALLTVPKVLKRGKIIYEKDNHKGNGFPTVTIAAPVVINGKKVVVAAVVQKTGKNKYHAHRVLLPDGSVFVLEKTDAELSTASMLSIKAQQRLPNNSASSISIPQNPEMSTTKSDFSLENVSEEANQQASGDFSKLWEAAGITEPSADLVRSMNALREMAAREDVEKKEIERTANAVASSMAAQGVAREGESLEALEKRLKKEILAEVQKKTETVKTDTPAKRARSAEAEYKRAEYWKAKKKETDARVKLLSDLDFDLKKVADMKKGRYVNASKLKNDSFTTAINELSKMNWKGGLVSDKKIREHFAQLSAWYSPKNALYGHDGNPNERYKQDIKDALSELGDTSAGALSNDDLRMADEVVKYFRNEIDTYGTIFKNGKREDAQPHVENYVAKIELSNQIVSRSSNIIKILRSNFARQFADPAMLMRLADSYVEGGFFTEQFEEMRQGAISAAVLERELLSRFESFWSGAAGKAYSKRYNDTEIELRGRKMPIAEAISLYMTLKRDHTLAGAAYAGFEIEGKEKTINVSDGFAEIVEACRADILSKLSAEEQLTLDKDDHAIIEQQALREAADRVMSELDASFTEKDRELISITEEIMEKCRDYKVAVDEILQGASNVTGGYYYPVKRIGLAENVDTMSMFEGDRVSNLSINKETVKNAHKLLIEPAHVVLMRHVKAISLYHGLGVFTDNFNRLYNLNISENANNPTTIRTSLGRASRFAKEMVSYFKEMKQDVEGISKTKTAEKWYNDSVLAIRSAYATYQLGFNLKTGFTQLSSVAASTSMLDPDALAKGIAVKNKGDVDEYCRLAWLRNNDGAAVLAQTVTTGMNAVQKQGRGAMQKVRDASMWHIGKMDRVVIQTLWGASQVQIEKDGGAKVGTEANKKAAGKLLERVILETQQNSLATERSAAMRSSDQILKALTMFRSDAMKLGARWLDAVGKWYSVNAQIRIAKDRLGGGDAKAGADIKRLQSEKKTAAKACARVTGAVMSTALFSAALSILWKWLMDRDDEENGWTFFFDVLGNLIGGVPVFSDIYSFFVDGFEVENFIIDTVNNVLGAIRGTAAMTVDAINGKEVSKQDVLNNLKKLAFALGQGSGISTRNIYNFITGIISRVSPEAGIWIEMQFSSRSVAGDLKKAMEDGDDQMVDTIVGIMLDQDGGDMNEGTRRATAKLIKSGYEGILPRSIPETLTNAQDVEVELTKKQRQQFEKVYSAAYRAADDLVRMGYFKAASKDEQAYALKFIWSTYYALAKDTVLGEDSTKKNVLFAEAIPVERLALIVAQASAIKADVDKNGKAINGSRMHKIEALIESLHLSAAQKYMMMGYLGYTNKKGRELVERYIRTLGLSQAEQAELLEMSGYREK